MNKITKNLLILKQLKINLEEVEAYDGYTKEDMIETFIKKNGYNPIIEFKLQKSKLKRIVFKKLSKKIRKTAKELKGKEIFSILNQYHFFDKNLKTFLDAEIKEIKIELTEAKSIKSFLFDFYLKD